MKSNAENVRKITPQPGFGRLAVPTERVDQPAAFDVLQHQIETLDQLLCNMTDVVDMADELADAAKKPDDAASELMERLHRQARAYKALQPILNAAERQSGDVAEQLASFLKASSTLARHLARWQSEG
jgi:ABC-type transporter Mla subunit MlaD